MAKKRSWFDCLKNLFIPEGRARAEKKSNKWKRVFEKFSSKQVFSAPVKTLSAAIEEQRMHILNVATATATAAEAAVAAAHAAAEVVRLTGASERPKQHTLEDENLGAIKIQAAFRAHLARKAFRALKGLVRLQALVRGRAVRRQLLATLKFSPSIPNRQLQKCDCKDIVEASSIVGETKQFNGLKDFREQDIKLKTCNSLKGWDYSMLSKEDLEAIWLRKHEGIVKRERMKKYSYSSYQERANTKVPEESSSNKGKTTEPSWIDEHARQNKTSNSGGHVYSASSDICDALQCKLRYMLKQEKPRQNFPSFQPRRSFSHVRQKSFGESSFSSYSPIFPTYMTATESTNAKVRSMSTPKQRLGLYDTCFASSLAGESRVLFWPTYNGGRIPTDGKVFATQNICGGTKKIR